MASYRLYRRNWRKKHPTTGVEYAGTTSTWWVSITLAGRRLDRSLGVTSERLADRKARALLEELEAGLSGDRTAQHRRSPIEDHVAAYHDAMPSDTTAKHRDETLACIREFVVASGVGCIADLDLVRAQAWLASLHRTPIADEPRAGEPGTRRAPSRRRRGHDRLSARSINKRAQALRSWGRWLVEAGRATSNPFAGLRAMRGTDDRRVVRRALTEAEVARLVAAARARPLDEAKRAAEAEAARRAAGAPPRRTAAVLGAEDVARWRRTGERRALAYLLLVRTGLRRSEAAGLRWADLHLDDAAGPRWTLPAALDKAGQDRDLPFVEGWADDLVARLRALRSTLDDPDAASGEPVLGRRGIPSVRTLRADLEAAGIEPTDASGRVIDLHALRTTCGTLLTARGVHPRVVQALMRHASIDLTMGTYSDVALLDLRGCVRRAGGRAGGTSAASPEAANASPGLLDAVGAAGRPETAPNSAVDSVPPDAHFGALRRTSEGSEGSSRRASGKRADLHANAPNRAIPEGERMARPEGVEPPTFGSVVRCSIQLS